MRTGNAAFRRLILIAGTFLLVLPACTGFSGSSSTSSGLPILAALGLDESQTDVLDTPATLDCTGVGEPASATHLAMLETLNLYREQNGLSLLSYSQRLEAAADAHVQDLWARGFFDHVNPDGLGPSERALEVGFCHQYVGENIAAGQISAEGAMIAWQNSPPHNDNLLEPDFAYVGMGHFVAPTGRHYWGQLFAFDLP